MAANRRVRQRDFSYLEVNRRVGCPALGIDAHLRLRDFLQPEGGEPLEALVLLLDMKAHVRDLAQRRNVVELERDQLLDLERAGDVGCQMGRVAAGCLHYRCPGAPALPEPFALALRAAADAWDARRAPWRTACAFARW